MKCGFCKNFKKSSDEEEIYRRCTLFDFTLFDVYENGCLDDVCIYVDDNCEITEEGKRKLIEISI